MFKWEEELAILAFSAYDKLYKFHIKCHIVHIIYDFSSAPFMYACVCICIIGSLYACKWVYWGRGIIVTCQLSTNDSQYTITSKYYDR